MTRRSRKMPLEDIFNRLYARSEHKKPNPNSEESHAQENNSQKKKSKRERATPQEEAAHPEEHHHSHPDDQEPSTQEQKSRQNQTQGQKESTQHEEQSTTDTDENTTQEEYVCMLHRIKESFYTSNGNIAHVREEKPMMVALLRAFPIRKDAECNITVDGEDPN